MSRPVMRAAERDQIVGIVSATLCTMVDMMKVQKACIAATGHHAPVVIAAQHRPARRGRDGLLRTHARVGAFMRDDLGSLLAGDEALVRRRASMGTEVPTDPRCCPSHSAIATTSAPTGTSSPPAC